MNKVPSDGEKKQKKKLALIKAYTDVISGERGKKEKQKKKDDVWKKKLALIKILVDQFSPKKRNEVGVCELVAVSFYLILLFACLCIALYIYYVSLSNLFIYTHSFYNYANMSHNYSIV